MHMITLATCTSARVHRTYMLQGADGYIQQAALRVLVGILAASVWYTTLATNMGTWATWEDTQWGNLHTLKLLAVVLATCIDCLTPFKNADGSIGYSVLRFSKDILGVESKHRTVFERRSFESDTVWAAIIVIYNGRDHYDAVFRVSKAQPEQPKNRDKSSWAQQGYCIAGGALAAIVVEAFSVFKESHIWPMAEMGLMLHDGDCFYQSIMVYSKHATITLSRLPIHECACAVHSRGCPDDIKGVGEGARASRQLVALQGGPVYEGERRGHRPRKHTQHATNTTCVQVCIVPHQTNSSRVCTLTGLAAKGRDELRPTR